MNPAGGRPWLRTLGLGGFLAAAVAATLLALLVGDGSLAVALGPLLLFTLLWAIWVLPLRVTLFAMTFLALAMDSPNERPHASWWEPPWSTVAALYLNALHHTLPIGALRFSGLEFLLVYLFAIVAWRRATHSRRDPPAAPTPRPLARALAISFGAVLVLLVYGLARGGDATQAIWQARILLVTPLVAGLYLHALRGPADAQALGRIVVAAAFVKVLLGAYFYYRICKPYGLQPPYVTTHTDSVLFTLAIATCLAHWWERPTPRALAIVGLVTPVMMFGIVLNDRRLAWVTLGAMVLAIVLISPWNRAKRALARAAVVCLPLWVAYASVGWHSGAAVFKPVQVLRSVVSADTGSDRDGSTEFREMENFNLVQTIAPHPLAGAGFGHEYDEVLKLPDISRAMPFYRYLPHNTVLWLWTLGGWLGFTALWLYLLVAVFLAARAYHRATGAVNRASMLVAICSVVAYLNQAFGDMGVQAYGSVFTIAPAVALAGSVAARVGAWREPRAKRRVALPPEMEVAVP